MIPVFIFLILILAHLYSNPFNNPLLPSGPFLCPCPFALWYKPLSFISVISLIIELSVVPKK